MTIDELQNGDWVIINDDIYIIDNIETKDYFLGYPLTGAYRGRFRYFSKLMRKDQDFQFAPKVEICNSVSRTIVQSIFSAAEIGEVFRACGLGNQEFFIKESETTARCIKSHCSQEILDLRTFDTEEYIWRFAHLFLNFPEQEYFYE